MRAELAIGRFAVILLLLILGALPARADNWQASIYEYGAPRHLVGVDKKKGLFNFFEKKSPFRLRFSYPCVTGQLPGDKQRINDLRTPEGIYFVEYKIASGLDFREYGGIAYTLNYPNPVDRLRGKTGHGIWIHSKGFELLPTRGCVAIGRDNIAEVGPLLLPGTPVVLAEELKDVASADNGTLATLRGLMSDWSKAWAARSRRMFDFYDPDAYSRATENFDLFRQNKERLFKILSFIKIYNREIHALEGPGYWVTWSEQFYTASNLSTEGVRRLYWQKDAAGKFRIVGMEWTPRDVGMRAAFQKGALVAEGPATQASDAEAPVAPRLDMPEAPKAEPAEKPGVRASLLALAENLLAISEPLVPRKQTPATPDEIIWGEGRSLQKGRETGVEPGAQKPAGEPPAQAAPAKKPEARPTPALTLPGAPKGPEILNLNDDLKKQLARAEGEWRDALERREANMAAFYDASAWNRLPAALDVPRGQSLDAHLRQIRRDFKQQWIEILGREPQISVKGQIARTDSPLLLVMPQSMRQGTQSLWWRKDKDGKFRIVGARFREEPLGLEADYLEAASDEIARALEAWRAAWEAGDVNAYMAFYAPNAWQQGRSGAANIRRQKEGLWSRVKPSRVSLSGLRVSLENGGARADMTQAYADSAGRADKGVKTIHLRYDGKRWLIQREEWANLAQ